MANFDEKEVLEVVKTGITSGDELTPTEYFNFLKDVQSEVSVHAESERRLCVLSKGFNRDIYFSYVDVNENFF